MVTATAGYDEERLGELLALLRPAPAAWVRAAQELPLGRRELDELVERARVDATFRAALLADLESALDAAGYEPTDALVEEIRACLADPDR